MSDNALADVFGDSDVAEAVVITPIKDTLTKMHSTNKESSLFTMLP